MVDGDGLENRFRLWRTWVRIPPPPPVEMRGETMGKRTEQPIRYRILRSDTTVGVAEQTIEQDYGLPPGSVRIVHPSGKNARSDELIGTLRKEYE